MHYTFAELQCITPEAESIIISQFIPRNTELSVLAEVYYFSDTDKMRLYVQERLHDRKRLFHDWKVFYDQGEKFLQYLAIHQMSDLAQVFHEWELVYKYAYGKRYFPLYSNAIENMEKQPKHLNN